MAATNVHLSDESALGTRVVVSPLLTLVMSLLDALGDRPVSPWRRMLRDRAKGLDAGPLAMFAQPAFMLPNGLLPLPATHATSFARELEALRRTPVDLLRFDLRVAYGDRVPPELAPFVTEPDAAIARYCDALSAHWDRMLAPSWPRLRRVLEREVLLVGHDLATHGLSHTLQNLHPALRYEAGCLSYELGRPWLDRFEASQALILAPMAGEPDRILANEDHPEATVIAYSARGSAELWDEAAPRPAGELARLLGRTRATIALALAVPATTSELAERLGLAPSTVSRHLSALSETGLTDRARCGPLVYYRLSARGTALLDLF